jgi:outer membrane protein assembly factor BamB
MHGDAPAGCRPSHRDSKHLRRLRTPLAVGVALAAATLGLSCAATPRAVPSEAVADPSGFGSDWSTYHGNAEDTGVDAAGTTLRPSQAAWTSSSLDGQLFGEPLVADGRVVAATENDTVYLMAADTGQILWSRHPLPRSDRR